MEEYIHLRWKPSEVTEANDLALMENGILTRRLTTNNPRKIYSLRAWCRSCWQRFAVDIEWKELEGKTFQETLNLVNDKHRPYCKTPDCRLENFK